MKSGGLDFSNNEITVNTYENGAMAKMELLLPAHHVTSRYHDLYLKFVARNSYNAKWKFQVFLWMDE